ncbi:MAG: wax ester/triacylglycerol synthase domain-containing protein [Jiangellales bacterium]
MAPRRDLAPADACWLYSEWENNHQTVSAFMWTDGHIDPDDLREVVATRLVDKYPVFAQRAVMSRNPPMIPHWEDDPDFDVDRHILVVQCPAPGDKAALEALVSAQRTPLLHRARPLKTIYLIQDCEGGTSAVHARTQHAIADGWSPVRP